MQTAPQTGGARALAQAAQAGRQADGVLIEAPRADVPSHAAAKGFGRFQCGVVFPPGDKLSDAIFFEHHRQAIVGDFALGAGFVVFDSGSAGDQNQAAHHLRIGQGKLQGNAAAHAIAQQIKGLVVLKR